MRTSSRTRNPFSKRLRASSNIEAGKGGGKMSGYGEKRVIKLEARWWFQIFLFSSLFEEDSHFD